jgi:putative peptidoglycan lipid II flippase
MGKKLLRSTALVGSMTLVSRILGFVRDLVVAHLFGAGAGTDAFFVAFRIPNFLRRLFAEGAFAQAFVPVLSEYRQKRDILQVRELMSHVAGSLSQILLVVTLVGIAGAPLIMWVFAPGFVSEPDKMALATDLLRITFPYILLVSLTALAGAALNTYGHFMAPAFTPVFLNLAMIASALLLSPLLENPVISLAYGVLIGGVFQLLFQWPFLAKFNLLIRPRRGNHPGVTKIKKLMIPALFSLSVTQINLLVDTLIASFLVTGSISWLYYAERMVEFPLGIFGIALATVVLPSLSAQSSKDDMQSFSSTLDWALRLVVIVGLPSMLGLWFLAEPIMATLFQYGAFGKNDAINAAAALSAYSLGLLGFILVKVLATGFFSRQDTRTPVKIAIIAMVANMIMNVILVFPLAHVGLALATALSALINASLLYRLLRKQGVYQPQSGWPILWLRIIGAATIMCVGMFWLSEDLAEWLSWSATQRAMTLLTIIFTGAFCYIMALWLSGFRLHHLNRSAKVGE